MTDSRTSASTPEWLEFTTGMCEQLNCHRCLVLVGDAAVVQPAKALVDEASRHATVAAAFATALSSTNTESAACSPLEMPHVAFTSAENQRMAQRCMALYGRVPFLAVLDMRDDDDEHAFVFDLKDKITKVDGAAETATPSPTLSHEVAEFLVRVGRGTEPRGRQGAAPPPADVFKPTHGAVLHDARAAVTSTFTRLLGKPAVYKEVSTAACSSCPCGALCVFWSDRCPCCPGVLMLIEALVGLIRLVAARHADHPASSISFTFPLLVANIDENDFSAAEWPVAKREQVVPSLVAYPAPSFEPVIFTGERSLPRLVSFICTHCLPSADCVACTPHITEEVEKVVAQLSIDELMTTIEEGGEAYAAAASAFEAFEKCDSATADDTAALFAAFHGARTAALPFSFDSAVRRMSAEGGAAAAGSAGGSMRGDVDGGEETEDGDDVAETKAGGWVAASATATRPQVADANAYKRPRE